MSQTMIAVSATFQSTVRSTTAIFPPPAGASRRSRRCNRSTPGTPGRFASGASAASPRAITIARNGVELTRDLRMCIGSGQFPAASLRTLTRGGLALEERLQIDQGCRVRLAIGSLERVIGTLGTDQDRPVDAEELPARILAGAESLEP